MNKMYCYRNHNIVNQINGSVGAQGNMRVTDYKRRAGVIFSERGDLGLAFEDISITGILAALAPRVAGVPIAQSVFAALSTQAMGYAAIYLAQQFKGFAKDNGWLADGDPLVIDLDGDPLVIDLDGDGIETIGLGSAVRRMAANDNESSTWARRAYCTRLTA